jgi:catechol 1,2-dioxygenase
LIVDFVPKEGDPKADFDLAYDFKLATFEDAAKECATGTMVESSSGVGAKT